MARAMSRQTRSELGGSMGPRQLPRVLETRQLDDKQVDTAIACYKSQIMGPKQCVMDPRTRYHSPTLFRTNPNIGSGTDAAEDNARNQPLDLSTARSRDQS